MTPKSFFASAAILFCSVSALQAQDASLLGAGTRVKLVTPALDAANSMGRIVEATRDTIVFRSDAFPVTRTFAVTDINSIEVSAGKQTHRGRDALYGLAIGGAAGALAGTLAYKKPEPGCWMMCETRGGDAVAGALFGGIVGSLVGAFIVGSYDKTERWVPLRKTASIRVMPANGGVNLAMSARF